MPERGGGPPAVVEVLPDVTGIDRTFHYTAPEGLAPIGAIVRVALHGRRVRGWVVQAGSAAPSGVELQPIIELVSLGPPPEVVELCKWAAWRFAGRVRPLLVAASPERVVRSLPPRRHLSAGGREGASAPPAVREAVGAALALGDAVLRLPPGSERLGVVEAALAAVPEVLVLVESRRDVALLVARLKRAGWPVSAYPEEWEAAAGPPGVVVGTRNAVFAPSRPDLVVVLDAHSEAYRSERTPTFDARVVAAERARREGARLLYVSPCPPLELLAGAGRRLVDLPARPGGGWGTVSVLDSRKEDPAEGGYPSLLVDWIRSAVRGEERLAGERPPRPVVCILNRVGRARLLSCGGCRSVQRCADCGAALVQLEKPAQGELGRLVCPRCHSQSAALCAACGSSRLRLARPGVSRAREQLAAVTGLAVAEMSGPRAEVPEASLIMATQAALHRLRAASMVVWLDFDQELLAPRFRAAEEALSLLARSVRLVWQASPSGGRPAGGPSGTGRVVVRTSMPGHEVLRAALEGRPELVSEAEQERRQLLRLPPYSSLARVDGPGAAALVGRLPENLAPAPTDSGYIVRADSGEALADAFAAVVAGEAAGWAGLDARVEMEPLDL